MLGIVLALGFNLDLSLGILFVATSIALSVYMLEKEKRFASDTLLGIFAHGALALGLVILSLMPSVGIDISGLLFGDILAVNAQDIRIIYICAMVIGLLLALQWKNLMRLVVHADIAAVEGIRVERLRLVLMLAIAAAVAVSIKIVGILLITSMLIIPAASMRYFARNPTQMAIFSIVAGIASVVGGLYASLLWDTPSGPSIILAALAIFFGSYVIASLRSTTTGT